MTLVTVHALDAIQKLGYVLLTVSIGTFFTNLTYA